MITFTADNKKVTNSPGLLIKQVVVKLSGDSFQILWSYTEISTLKIKYCILFNIMPARLQNG